MRYELVSCIVMTLLQNTKLHFSIHFREDSSFGENLGLVGLQKSCKGAPSMQVVEPSCFWKSFMEESAPISG